MKDKENLIGQLALTLASGKVDPQYVLPVMQLLVDHTAQPVSIPELLGILHDENNPVIARLVRHLREVRRNEALAFHQKRQIGAAKPQDYRATLGDLPLEVDVPGGWQPVNPIKTAIELALDLIKGKLFLVDKMESVPQIFNILRQTCDEEMARANQAMTSWGGIITPELVNRVQYNSGDQPAEWGLIFEEVRGRLAASQAEMAAKVSQALEGMPALVPAGLDELLALHELEKRFAAAETRDEKLKIADLVCSWPTTRGIPTILAINQQDWVRERSVLLLTLRFGQPALRSWEDGKPGFWSKND